MTDPLIFPIGHYLGASYLQLGANIDSHVVRVGWRLHRLERIDQFAVWALAHGLPEGNEMAPWTRGAVAGAARASGIAGASTALAELDAMDLIIEVEPGTADAVDFAKVCRLRALLTGTGERDARDGMRYGIGWIGAAPAVEVDPFTYELWKWGPACDSLWHICEVLARVQDPSDPEEVLTRCLRPMQVLLAHGAAFLDEAREDWDRESSLADVPGLAD